VTRLLHVVADAAAMRLTGMALCPYCGKQVRVALQESSLSMSLDPRYFLQRHYRGALGPDTFECDGSWEPVYAPEAKSEDAS
jgi:hypothetical protein